MFLRDFSLLWQENFAYRWSNLKSWNTAVMGFNKYLSPSVKPLLKAIVADARSFNDLVNRFHPLELESQIKLVSPDDNVFTFQPMRTFHSYLFDPAWLCSDGALKRKEGDKSVCAFGEFCLRNMTDDEFQPDRFAEGALAYHMHLGHATNVQSASFFARFESYYAGKLQLYSD